MQSTTTITTTTPGASEFEVKNGDTVFLFNKTHRLFAASPTLQNYVVDEKTSLTRYYPVLTISPENAALLRISSPQHNYNIEAGTSALRVYENVSLQFIDISGGVTNQFVGVLSKDNSEVSGGAQVVLYNMADIANTEWRFDNLAASTAKAKGDAPTTPPVGPPITLVYGKNYTIRNLMLNLYLSLGYKLSSQTSTFGVNNLQTDTHIDEWQILPSQAVYTVGQENIAPVRGNDVLRSGFLCSDESTDGADSASSSSSYVCRNLQNNILSLNCTGGKYCYQVQLGDASKNHVTNSLFVQRHSQYVVLSAALVFLVALTVCLVVWFRRH